MTNKGKRSRLSSKKTGEIIRKIRLNQLAPHQISSLLHVDPSAFSFLTPQYNPPQTSSTRLVSSSSIPTLIGNETDLATSMKMMKSESAEDGVSSSIGSSSGSSGSSSGDSSSIGNNGGDSSNNSELMELQNELKKMRDEKKKDREVITELKRKREEDQLAFQSLKKKYDRVNENMQETRKKFANLLKDMDARCQQLEEGQYIITFEGIEKVLEQSQLNDLVKRKQPNVVLEHLMKLFLLETISAQQFRGLDLIMQRMCPLMPVSKSRFKNFKQRKGALFNRQAVDDGTTARSRVVLVNEHSIEDVLLSEDEQNTALDNNMMDHDNIQEETTQAE